MFVLFCFVFRSDLWYKMLCKGSWEASCCAQLPGRVLGHPSLIAAPRLQQPVPQILHSKGESRLAGDAGPSPLGRRGGVGTRGDRSEWDQEPTGRQCLWP